jgi:hypothetical protein
MTTFTIWWLVNRIFEGIGGPSFKYNNKFNMIIIKYCNIVIKIIFIFTRDWWGKWNTMRIKRVTEERKRQRLLKGLLCQKLRCSWNSKIEYDFQDVVISLPACQSLNQL